MCYALITSSSAQGFHCSLMLIAIITQFCFYGDRIPNEPENALYISNHQCSGELDYYHAYGTPLIFVTYKLCLILYRLFLSVDWVIF